MRAIWIEIPVTNLERAMKFYQTVFNLSSTDIIADDVRRITILPTPEGAANVSLNQTVDFEPSAKGTLAYFNVDGDLSETLEKVESANGKIIDGKTQRGDNGFFALITDSEGNLLTIHSIL
ncbi:MAG: VOC family protein [Pyrinomonadaceae bacterium]|nr:VOC family protein [Pyrinomonadaceae bacterium]